MRKDLYKELYEVENNHWWHKHKRKVIFLLINQFTQKGKVLDVGAGTGKILAELKKKGWKIEGIDGEKEAVKWSKKRGVTLKQVNVEKKLPFKTGDFDLVLALDVLEHLDKVKEVLREINRILKQKSIAIITVPAYQWLFNYWDEMLGHKKRYTTLSLKEIIDLKSFKIEYLGYFSMFVFPMAIIVRVIKKVFNKTQISDFQTTPLSLISVPIINFFNLIERMLLSFVSLPFGLSVICVIRKK